jgi:hypothetical protein
MYIMELVLNENIDLTICLSSLKFKKEVDFYDLVL